MSNNQVSSWQCDCIAVHVLMTVAAHVLLAGQGMVLQSAFGTAEQYRST
jgi:hypothetical protein